MPLDDTDRQMIDKLEAQLKPALAQARKWMRAINAIYEAADEPAPYGDNDDVAGAATGGRGAAYGPTEFYDQPLATVVRRLLTDQPSGLTIDRLYDMMVSGGYAFEESSAEKAKNNLKISLGKYSQFDRTPNGYYVMAKGKPSPKKPDAKKAAGNGDAIVTPTPTPESAVDAQKGATP
jgi:hypothetical protein